MQVPDTGGILQNHWIAKENEQPDPDIYQRSPTSTPSETLGQNRLRSQDQYGNAFLQEQMQAGAARRPMPHGEGVGPRPPAPGQQRLHVSSVIVVSSTVSSIPPYPSNPILLRAPIRAPICCGTLPNG